MESNITEQQYFDGDLQLAEPHFDEEATALSARPVVPLEQIKTKARSGRRLALGLSIVVSLMVGALGATLIYKQRAQKPAIAIVDTAVTGSGASAALLIPETNKEEVPAAEVRAADVPAGERKPNLLPRRVDPAKIETRQNKSTAQEDEREMRREDEREMRRNEKIDAWRLRRQEGREARRERRGKGGHSDDLLRIRDIFEGSRRP